jgi:hypothetical protein
MSEAKLKAEARRAKILAREGNRLAVAMGEQVEALARCHAIIGSNL